MGRLDLRDTSASEVPTYEFTAPRQSASFRYPDRVCSATFICVPRYFVEPGDNTVFCHLRFDEADSK